jgi:hypothetical protein
MNNKIRILYLGNCQVAAIKHLLNLDPKIYDQEYFCLYKTTATELQKEKLIQNSDIIITQPVSNKFGSFAINNVIKLKNKDTKIIIFPSCYMHLYYFDSLYYFYNDALLTEPSHYHYSHIAQSFLKKESIETCINQYILNIKLKNQSELMDIYYKDILELTNRIHSINQNNNNSNVHILDIINFIANNYKSKLLFYSFNHPTKILLEYITTLIKERLNLDSTLPRNTDVLSSTRGIIYSCLQNIVDFDINQYQPLIAGQSDIKNIVKLFYNSYNEQNINNENTKAGSYGNPTTV